jgi:hypothetical protein
MLIALLAILLIVVFFTAIILRAFYRRLREQGSSAATSHREGTVIELQEQQQNEAAQDLSRKAMPTAPTPRSIDTEPSHGQQQTEPVSLSESPAPSINGPTHLNLNQRDTVVVSDPEMAPVDSVHYSGEGGSNQTSDFEEVERPPEPRELKSSVSALEPVNGELSQAISAGDSTDAQVDTFLTATRHSGPIETEKPTQTNSLGNPPVLFSDSESISRKFPSEDYFSVAEGERSKDAESALSPIEDQEPSASETEQATAGVPGEDTKRTRKAPKYNPSIRTGNVARATKTEPSVKGESVRSRSVAMRVRAAVSGKRSGREISIDQGSCDRIEGAAARPGGCGRSGCYGHPNDDKQRHR